MRNDLGSTGRHIRFAGGKPVSSAEDTVSLAEGMIVPEKGAVASADDIDTLEKDFIEQEKELNWLEIGLRSPETRFLKIKSPPDNL